MAAKLGSQLGLRRGGSEQERGNALSVFVALAIPFLILVAGIAVDGGGQVVLEQEAKAVAADAARAGGQAVRGGITGESVQADPGLARKAALAYLAGSKFRGEVKVVGQTVHVTINAKYKTVFLSLVAINELPVHAEATARLIQSYEGHER